MKMSKLLRFGVKAGIMSSAIYLTVDKGVWKDNETTGELFQELQKQIKPLVKPLVEQIPFEVPQLPKTGDMASTAKTTWNKAVMASCLFLVELPQRTVDFVVKGSVFTYQKINEQIDALSNVDNEEKTDSKPAA